MEDDDWADSDAIRRTENDAAVIRRKKEKSVETGREEREREREERVRAGEGGPGVRGRESVCSLGHQERERERERGETELAQVQFHSNEQAITCFISHSMQERGEREREGGGRGWW